MSDKCFKKCITKPGATLDNPDQVRLSFYILISFKYYYTVIF